MTQPTAALNSIPNVNFYSVSSSEVMSTLLITNHLVRMQFDCINMSTVNSCSKAIHCDHIAVEMTRIFPMRRLMGYQFKSDSEHTCLVKMVDTTVSNVFLWVIGLNPIASILMSKLENKRASIT
jgi:hypothetical protein